ncbi:hypothetical protein QZH41_020111, partial [Actinostola sp. cb2023]
DSDGEGASGFNVKYKLRHFQRFRILLAVAAILFVLCVVFMILFAVEKSRRTTVQRDEEQPVCSTKDCVLSSYDIIQQLNQTADPCVDFYAYACGGWIEKNPLKPGETSRTGFSIVSEKNYLILKAAIESSWQNYAKVQTFYQQSAS